MIITLILLFLFFTVLLAFFIFPSLSPVPYFPTNGRDLKLVIKALRVKNDQIIVDLGAGDGTVIFEAAHEAQRKKLNTQFIAVEINPVLVLILHLRRLLHPNRKNVRVLRADMFELKVKSQKLKVKGKAVTFYAYISPWLMKKLFTHLKREFKRFEFVSYFYPLPKRVKEKAKIQKGVNKIFTYRLS